MMIHNCPTTEESEHLLGTTASSNSNVETTLQNDAGSSSVASSIINLSNTILGAGLLSIPYTLNITGLVFGLVLLSLGGIGGMFGLHLLVECVHDLRMTGVASYYSVADSTFPYATIIVNMAVALKCFGVAVGYLIVVGELLPPAICNISNLDPKTHLLGDRRFWISCCMAITISLSLVSNINSLRFTSIIAIATVLYVMGMMCGFYISYVSGASTVTHQELHWWEWNIDIFKALPIIVFSFTCHQNIFTIYTELFQPETAVEGCLKIKRITAVITYSVLACFVVYVWVGILGYLTFPFETLSNIIKQYPSDNQFVNGAGISVSVLCILSYPLQIHPCRVCLDKVMFSRIRCNLTPSPSVLYIRRICIVLLVSLSTFGIAYVLDDLGVVFGVIGATGSTTLCYILPGMLYLKVQKLTASSNRWFWTARCGGATFFIIFGFFMMAIGNYVIIENAMKSQLQ